MKTIPLSKPLIWGEQKITELILRRPTAGDLRGIKLQGISDMDVNTIMVVLPRISTTPLAPGVVNDLDPADLLSVCEAISGFFSAQVSPSPKTP